VQQSSLLILPNQANDFKFNHTAADGPNPVVSSIQDAVFPADPFAERVIKQDHRITEALAVSMSVLNRQLPQF
jgi:hypothetical protein